MTDIFSMLDGVRDNGGDNFMARCPAHDDRTPSLSVKLCGDGRVLLHCFGGCDVEAVTDALGLQLTDLMPERPLDHRVRRVRSRMPARDGLQSLDHESLAVAVIASDLLDNRSIDEPTWSRLAQAVARIGKVRDECMPMRHRP